MEPPSCFPLSAVDTLHTLANTLLPGLNGKPIGHHQNQQHSFNRTNILTIYVNRFLIFPQFGN